jgi:hypothetical protein
MDVIENDLEKFCEGALSRNVLPEVHAVADFLKSMHPGAVAILAYGSCIRGVDVKETLIDFYVLTETLADVSSNIISRLACAVVPPNVYYAEAKIDGVKLRAKYAVLPIVVFSNWMRPKTINPYFWARFSQPSALVFVRNAATRQAVVAAISTAISTCYANATSLTSSVDALEIWAAGFSATYATEFRSEKSDRAAQIVATYPEYYKEAASHLQSAAPIKANLAWRSAAGKMWQILRLIKAAFTFQGGADYVVWKIERHSGEKIILTSWQKRHPILAGMMLLPTLLRKGAVR